MRLEYDREVDAAYIYLQLPIKDGEAKKTIQLNDNIVLDFDENDKLIGVEVLNASTVLSEETIKDAQVA